MILPKPAGSASVGLEPAVPARRGVWAKLWPWLLSLVILAFLFTRIPRKALLTAIETGPWLLLGVYAFLQVVLVLCADAYATSVALAITGFKQRFPQIVLARGATYILGILNYAFGQGAFGLYLQRSGVAALRAAGTVLFLMIVNLGVLLFVASFGFLAGGYPGSENVDLSPLGYGLLSRGSGISRHHLVAAPLLAKLSIAGPIIGSWFLGSLAGGRREAPPGAAPSHHLLGGFASLGHSRPSGGGRSICARSAVHRRPPHHSRRFGHHPSCSGVGFQPVCPLANPRGSGCRHVGLRPDILFVGNCFPGSDRSLLFAEATSYLSGSYSGPPPGN